jgi:UDP-glucose 4-epimerase
LLSNERPVIYGDGEQSRDFTYIDNVVFANLRAAEADDAAGKVINVANGERITLNQLLAELKDLTGKQDVSVEYLEPRVGDVRHSLADISMAQQLLGYESKVDLREGLKRTIDWWKSSRFNRG